MGATAGGHRVNSRRVQIETVQKRLAGLALVPLRILGLDKPFVAPPNVDLLPVDGTSGGGVAQGGEGGDSHPATG